MRARGASGRLPEQAEIVRRFIEALGLEKPLVVGHSLGGAIALTLAVEHPEAISGVALLAPLTHMEPDAREKFGPLYINSPLRRRIMAHTVANPGGSQICRTHAGLHLRATDGAGRLYGRGRRLVRAEAKPFLRNIDRCRGDRA
ncbi:alpha/beta hydrolase [Mesorhizobium sp. M0340]|uniref:alpha/beta fold hydrolase n=1 Tax=Mesorhizobium sp. M0340 TaxID=2956939 RepID=UPI003339EE39